MAEPKQKPGKSRQDYATPPEFIDAVKRRLGIAEFAVDLAADASNHKADEWLDLQTDSLSVDWTHLIRDGWGWLNPPFANIAPWAKKCASTVYGTDAKIAFLVPASVGSNWYRDYVDRAFARTLFLNGRISFDGVNVFPKDCMLVLYGRMNGNEVWSWRAPLKKAA